MLINANSAVSFVSNYYYYYLMLSSTIGLTDLCRVGWYKDVGWKVNFNLKQSF